MSSLPPNESDGGDGIVIQSGVDNVTLTDSKGKSNIQQFGKGVNANASGINGLRLVGLTVRDNLDDGSTATATAPWCGRAGGRHVVSRLSGSSWRRLNRQTARSVAANGPRRAWSVVASGQDLETKFGFRVCPTGKPACAGAESG